MSTGQFRRARGRSPHVLKAGAASGAIAAVRRSQYVFFQFYDGVFVDVARLLAGEVEREALRQIIAVSALTGAERAVSNEELEVLQGIPSDEWTAVERPDETILALAQQGLLVTDARNGRLAELRAREERLAAEQWDPYAALYHFFGRRRDLTLELEGPLEGALTRGLDEFVAEHGRPPPAFHPRRSGAVRLLPQVDQHGELYDALARRRTARAFDTSAPLTERELSAVLGITYGCRATAALHEDLVLIKRTSPSGGGLHPIEVYPLVRDVEGLERGLYHYDVERHALALLRPLTAAEVEELGEEVTTGQSWFRSAHVLFLNTARFYRTFWKYRHHRRAYGVILMDMGHLSQTMYLVCAHLGLAAFVTAAINGANIEDALGLDGYEEGAIAVTGCGRPALERSPLEPEFTPYAPGRAAR